MRVLAFTLVCASLALAVAPALATLVGAFRQGGEWTLEPLRTLLSADRFVPLCANSLKFALTATVVATFLGTLGASLTFKLDTPMRRVLLFLTVISFMLPPFVTANGWRLLLGASREFTTPVGAGAILGLTLTPWAALVAGMGLATVDAELEQTALLDGSAWATFFRVSLPLSAWAIGAAAVVVFILAVANTDVSDLMGVRTFGEEVYSQYQMARPAVAAATALPVLAMCLAAMAGARRLTRRFVSGLDYLHRHERLLLAPRGASRWVAWALGLAFVGLLAAPILDLVRATQNLHTFARTVAGARDQIARSALLGLAASALCLCASLPLCYAASKCKIARLALIGSVLLLVGAPAPVTGIGLIRIFNRPGALGAVYDSLFIVLLAMLCRALPFSLMITAAVLRSAPAQYDEMARLDGAGPWRRLWRVHVPLAWPGLLAAFLVTYVLCLGEVAATVLVTPPGKEVLSIHILDLAHYGVYANLAALSLAMILMVAPVGVGLYLVRKWIFDCSYSGR